MSLIDASFFVGDINIPNTGETNILNKLNLFIKKYEPECLEMILGYELYQAVLTENSARITSIKNGAVYTDTRGIKMKWKGLIHDENLSLIANYVFYYHELKSTIIRTGRTTGSKMKTDGGETVYPTENLIKVWREFSYETKQLCNFLWTNISNYPEINQKFLLDVVSKTKPVSVFGF